MLCSRLFCAPPALAQVTDPHKLLAEADRLAGFGSGRAPNQSTPKLARRSSAKTAGGTLSTPKSVNCVDSCRGCRFQKSPNVSAHISMIRSFENDERLRLRVLVIKGETDEDLDPSLSQRSWTEALAGAKAG